MELVTHALGSIALGRAGLNKVARMATPMLLLSGLAADLDWVTRFAGANAFLHGHRTASHSLVGTFVIVAGVAASFWVAGQKFPKVAVKILPALFICAAGAGSHLLLDLLNGYGVKLLWPFNARWYAWDIADSVDAWIIFFLLADCCCRNFSGWYWKKLGRSPESGGDSAARSLVCSWSSCLSEAVRWRTSARWPCSIRVSTAGKYHLG